MLELEKVDDEPVSVRIGGRDFEVEEETGYSCLDHCRTNGIGFEPN